MPAAGTTGNLYSEADNPNSVLGAPPTAPTPVPPPTKVEAAQPVPVKSRMADEGPDGRIRDTSTEAVTQPGKDLGFRNLDDEPKAKPTEAPAATPTEPVKEAQKEAAPVAEPKVYAGKFKSVEELERSYEEAQKLITRQGQEKAEWQRTAAQPAPVKTPEQVVAEQTEANAILNEFVADPKTFIEKNVVQRTLTALTAQNIRNEWLKDNPDIAEHEVRVAFEVTQLIQADPEIAKNPARLIKTATDNFRQFTGKIRAAGAKEALTTETRVIPLVSSTAPAPATEQPPSRAPQTQSDITDSHVAWLKQQEQRSHRGLRR